MAGIELAGQLQKHTREPSSDRLVPDGGAAHVRWRKGLTMPTRDSIQIRILDVGGSIVFFHILHSMWRRTMSYTHVLHRGPAGVRVIVVFVLAWVMLLVPVWSGAEGLTEQQGDAMLSELKEIRVLLKDLLTQRNVDSKRSRGPVASPEGAVVSITDKPRKGEATAKVTLVEFSDYQCPFCSRHARQTMPQLEEEYIKTGKVQYVFKDFPLEQIHPKAIQAAIAANCAGTQGKYWEMHDLVFSNQKAVEKPDLERHAENLDLNLEMFQACLANKDQLKGIQEDLAEGSKLTVQGTPTFFLGITDPQSSTMKIVHVLRGAQPFARFQALIDPLLEK